MSLLIPQIQGFSSISLGTVAPMLWIGKLSSVPCVRAGVNFLTDSIPLRVTGFLDCLVILRQSQRWGLLMSMNGSTRTWIGSRPVMQALRHSGGPVTQLLLNSRRMSTSVRHSAHLVIYCAFRVAVMTLNMIAGPHIIVLTSVVLMMNTPVRRRSVVSGVLCSALISASLTPSQCWPFGATCVCWEFSVWCHYAYALIFWSCAVDIHLCGEPCKLGSKKGCLGGCTKVWTHLCIHH